MDSEFTFDDILFAKVEYVGFSGEMNLILFFKDGRQPFIYEGVGWKARLAQKLVTAFERWGAKRISAGVYENGYMLAGHGYSPAKAALLLRKFVEPSHGTKPTGPEGGKAA